MRTEFAAPWSRGLKAITALVLLVLLAVAIRTGLLGILIGAGVTLACGVFAIRGYRLDGGQLLIRHPGWTKRVDLTGLEKVEVDPAAMDRSLRLFGIGGLFSFVGHFRNARLGSYLAYATCPTRAVVLRLPSRRVVVTPDDPQEFARAVLASSAAQPVPAGSRAP